MYVHHVHSPFPSVHLNLSSKYYLIMIPPFLVHESEVESFIALVCRRVDILLLFLRKDGQNSDTLREGLVFYLGSPCVPFFISSLIESTVKEECSDI